MLQLTTPVIPGRESEELFWGTKDTLGRHRGSLALPVNPQDGCDTIILRYKFSWFDRIKILFGQDLFTWMGTNNSPVQWPQLHLTDPEQLADGQVLPYDPEVWRAQTKQGWQRGEIVPSKTADGAPSTAMHPDLEMEMRKTVKEKLKEQLRKTVW